MNGTMTKTQLFAAFFGGGKTVNPKNRGAGPDAPNTMPGTCARSIYRPTTSSSPILQHARRRELDKLTSIRPQLQRIEQEGVRIVFRLSIKAIIEGDESRFALRARLFQR